ncbi:BTB/POZ domain-containing protein SETH6 [Capsicum chinense]|nr:BTB/POZ domain-containing protein SETH6 [Capsicum chinense]
MYYLGEDVRENNDNERENQKGQKSEEDKHIEDGNKDAWPQHGDFKVYLMHEQVMGNGICAPGLRRPISDVSSYLTIEVGSASFALHRVSRSNLTGLPGGSNAFELAVKFFYRVNVEITISNMVLLRCAARFMEMTEDFSEENLEIRTEVFLKDAIFPSMSNSISVLHRCEKLLPVSKEVNLVRQLTNAIANNACKEQLTSGLSKL